jgi:hypothetical protein
MARKYRTKMPDTILLCIFITYQLPLVVRIFDAMNMAEHEKSFTFS